MRIPSGKTDQNINFVAQLAGQRVTGLSSFTVYRSRNGAAPVLYTTPTVTELSSANMPGVYALLIDEDTTIASTSDSEEYTVHITATGMDPVTRVVEIYRRDITSGRTAVVDAAGLIDANMVKMGPTGSGTAQTARDIGASVLLSSGTGTGQLSITSGIASVNTTQWGGTAVASVTVRADLINIAGSAVNTAAAQLGVNVVNWKGATAPAMTGDAYARLGAPAGASVSADIAAIKADTATIISNQSTINTNVLAVPAAVWAVATRTLTSGANIVLAKGTGITGFNDLDASGIRGAVGMASANLDTQLAALPTANGNADALLDRANGVETSLTVRGAFRVALAALAGKVSGGGTGTETFRNVGDTKDRIVSVNDASGNRTSVTTDAT